MCSSDLAVFKEKKTVIVTFAANGGNGNMDATQVDKNSNYKLPECTFTPPADKVFDKWSVVIGSAQVVDKNPGDEIVASDNVTVTAKWKAKPIPKINITFDNDGGTGSMDAVSIDKGSSYTLPISKFTPPAGINNLRLGEAFLLGNDTAYGAKLPGTTDDAVILKAH